MPKTQPKAPDLLALAMRRARDDVATGRVPKRLPQAEDDSAADLADGHAPETAHHKSRSLSATR